MKLRNKKTGKVVDVIVYSPIGNYNIRIWNNKDYLDSTCNDEYLGEYKTLADLNEEWEDYKPAEPIKDDKMRQCLNLWTDLNGFKGELTYAEGEDWCSFYEEEEEAELVFSSRICPNLKNGEAYSIAELCGEEEE